MKKKLESLSFSPAEQKVLKILGNKRMSIAHLAMKFYGIDAIPMNGSVVMATTVRRIAMKCKAANYPWTVMGEGTGRTGRIVWRTSL